MRRFFLILVTCALVMAQRQPSLLNPASLIAEAPATFKVKMTTTKGDILIEVTREWAPLGADRFYNLVRAGFYSDAAFFRVIPGFVAQFGINAHPEVSSAWRDAKIKDDPVKQSNVRGTLCFATSGANTRTTQLFINYGDNSRLDALGFAPFGEITEGLEVADKIFADYRERPVQSLIESKGKEYLDAEFPMLDRIISATIQ
jgi:peptidyl-prolyl cis-trans isomerase A (cyclophilin A)